MTEEILNERKKRYLVLYKELKKLFPNSKLALNYQTQWQLLVAVQLSAQSKDLKVNEITIPLFQKYTTPKDFAEADIKELETYTNGVLYYRNKAKNIKNAAIKLINEFDGKLPKTMKELLLLNGVARKTANVILGTLWGIKEGIVVDTHMIRFAIRFGLTDYKDAVKIERDLMEIIPKVQWYEISYMVVDYGRTYGNPRSKKFSSIDPLIPKYHSAANFWPKY